MSTFSGITRLHVMGLGDFPNQWGDKFNISLQILEQGMDGIQTVGLPSTGTYVLAIAEGELIGDEARQKGLRFIGSLSSTVTVVIPSLTKIYFFKNDTTGNGDLHVSLSGGNSLKLNRGFYNIVLCDTVSVQEVKLAKTDVVHDNTSRILAVKSRIEALQARSGILSSASAAHPVGSIFISAVSINPNTLLGYGVWLRVGRGAVLMGQDDVMPGFTQAGSTGGTRELILSEAQMPIHNHGVSTSSAGAHTHQVPSIPTNATSTAFSGTTPRLNATGITNHSTEELDHTHTGTLSSEGSSQAMTLTPPHVVAYFWKRIE